MTSSPAPAPLDPGRTFPAMAADQGRIEPCPRRIRGVLNGRTVFDTTRALYVWDWPGYPQYNVPLDDVTDAYLSVDAAPVEPTADELGWHSIQVGEVRRHRAVQLHPADEATALAGTARFRWGALDAWFEEDEQVFVHPRNPYTRVDALRAHRTLRVEIDGVVLAETRSPVLLFETGLPTRYYVAKTDVQLDRLRPSKAVSSCPYKGTTTEYWSAEVNGTVHRDVAWCYAFPTTSVAPIAGMVAFYNEEVDLFVEGHRLTRESAPPSSRRTS